MSENPTYPHRDPWFDLLVNFFEPLRTGVSFGPETPAQRIAFLRNRLGAQERNDMNRFLEYGRQFFGRPIADSIDDLFTWLELELKLAGDDLCTLTIKQVADLLEDAVRPNETVVVDLLEDAVRPNEAVRERTGDALPEAPNQTIDLSRPRWHRQSRVLTVDDCRVEIAMRDAPKLFGVLDELEKNGWPPNGVKMPSGFLGARDAVNTLNKKLSSTSLRLTILNGNQRVGWRMLLH